LSTNPGRVTMQLILGFPWLSLVIRGYPWLSLGF
jgi:hypothetical protein